jgi:hypothetical protein
VDTYTKFVLTVIAASLSVIALQHSGVVPAFAESNTVQRVIICDAEDPSDVHSGCAKVFRGGLRVYTR